MVSLKSVAVHVDTPAQISPSKFFGDVEAWLDTNKIEPVNFRITGGWAAGFDICFGTTEQANLYLRSRKRCGRSRHRPILCGRC